MSRKFEIAKGFEDKEINLPKRSTAHSVGYDIEAAENVLVEPFHNGLKPTLVPTGVKAKFPENEALFLANRSSNPGKKGLLLANGIGVIESDYYGNPDNDGHLMFAFWNMSNEFITINKGDKIGQAFFQPFLITDDDEAVGERTGGWGSTDK